MACALLHNFLRDEMTTDPLENDLDDVEILHEEGDATDFIDTVESSQAWTNWRDNLARSMFHEWRGVLRH